MMTRTSIQDRVGQLFLVLAVTGMLVTVATGCEEAFSGGSITEFSISPSTIPETDVGMNDQFFTVNMSVIGFESEVTQVTLFIQQNDREEPMNPERELTVSDSQVTIASIKQTWFVQMSPGVYDIGATVTTADGSSVTQRNLGTVEIVES